MAILPILTEPDPRLREVSEPVESVDADISKLMSDMVETMFHADGCGLAAIQVGIKKRVLVVDIGYALQKKIPPLKMANPDIYWTSEEQKLMPDGCLSVPEYYTDTMRAEEIKVRYLDENNKEQDLHATGVLATMILHEVDHLNGVLFIDYLSRLKREMVLRKLRKFKKNA